MSEQNKSITGNLYTSDDLLVWRLKLIQMLLYAGLIVGLPTVLFGSYNAYRQNFLWLAIVFPLAYTIALGLAFLLRKVYATRAAVVLGLIYVLGILDLVLYGWGEDGRVFLLAFCVLASILFGWRVGVFSLGISVITLLFFVWWAKMGLVNTPGTLLIAPMSLSKLFGQLTVFFLLATLLVIAQNYLIPSLVNALEQSKQLALDLEASRMQAQQEAERAQQQMVHLNRATTLSHRIAGMRDREALGWQLVDDIADSFDLSQVNLFLVDANFPDYIILRAASGTRGQQLVADGLQLPISGNSLPAKVAQSLKEMSDSVSGTPHFPETCAEACFPLILRGNLLGVLDLHTVRTEFLEEDLHIARILSDQVATTVDVLNLFEAYEQRAEDMRRLYTQSSIASWGRVLETQRNRVYTLGDISESGVAPFISQVLKSKSPQSISLEDGNGHLLIVPLIARDLSLGVLAFSRSAGNGEWDTETLTMARVVAERLAIVLDNTRLLMESRQKAYYEEQLGHIGDIVWSNPSLDIIMEKSVNELGRLLNASEVAIYINRGSSNA